MSQSLSVTDYMHWFRHAAPYIHAHQNKTFVILLTGEAIEHEDNLQSIIHDLTLLHSLNIRLVLVFGAKPQINHALAQSNINSEFVGHRRITPRQSLPNLLNAVGTVRLKLEALLSMGLANSPMYQARIHVVSGNLVTAKPYGIHDGIDFQLTGEVRSINAKQIQDYLAQHSIVLLSPLGYSSTGEVFNVMAEEVACQTAIALQADKLIFLTEYAGIFDHKQQFIHELNTKQVDEYLHDQTEPALHHLLKSAQKAASQGVHRVHFLSYLQDGALLQELFTRDGIGSMVSNAHYEDVREANIDDIQGLMQLLRPLEQQGILVYRSRERLEQEINQFAVIERDGMIVACAALYPIPHDAQRQDLISAEIACVAVHPDYRKSNRGTQVLNFLQEKALKHGIQQLFILTTRTAHWFIEHGFQHCQVDDLPPARQALYNFQRNSQVYRKIIETKP